MRVDKDDVFRSFVGPKDYVTRVHLDKSNTNLTSYTLLIPFLANMSNQDPPQLRTSARIRQGSSSTPSLATPAPVMPEVTSSATTAQYAAEAIMGGSESELTELSSDEGDSGNEGKQEPPEAPSSPGGGAGKVPSPRRRSKSPRKAVTASSSGEGVKRERRVIHSDDDAPEDVADGEESASDGYVERAKPATRRGSPKDGRTAPPKKRDRQAEKERRRQRENVKDEPPKGPKLKIPRLKIEDAAKATHGNEQKGTKKLTLKINTSSGDRVPTPTATPTAEQDLTAGEPSEPVKRIHSRISRPRPTTTRADGEGEPSTAAEGKRKPERRDDERRDKDDKLPGKRPKRSRVSDDEVSDRGGRGGTSSKKENEHRDEQEGGEVSGGERRVGLKKKRDRQLESEHEEGGVSDREAPRARKKGDKRDRQCSSDVEEEQQQRKPQHVKPAKRDRGDAQPDDAHLSDHEAPRRTKKSNNTKRDRPHDSDDGGTAPRPPPRVKKVVVYDGEERKTSAKSEQRGTDQEFFDRPVVERGAKTPKTPRTPEHERVEDRGEKPKRREEGGDVDRMDTEGKAEPGKRKAVDDESVKPRVRRDEDGREREAKNEPGQDVFPKKKKNRPAPIAEPADAPSSDIEVLPSKKKHLSEKTRREDVDLEAPVRPRLQKRPGESKTARRVAELGGGGGGGTRTPGDGKPRTPLHGDGGEVTPLNRRLAVPKKVQYDPLAAAMSSLGAGGAGPSSGVSRC